MSRASFLKYATSVVLVSAAILAACALAGAQWTESLTVHGEVTAVEPPNAFDVAGYHIMLSEKTEFFSYYHSKKSASELRDLIAAGTIVQVFGSREHSSQTITATRVTVRDEVDRRISGLGVIDRVITPGSQPVYRADGYFLRLNPATEIRFSGGLTAPSDVVPGVWVRFEGTRSETGEVVLTQAEFFKPKLSRPKPDPDVSLEQVTAIPRDSLIDFDGGLHTGRNKHRMEDAGGECGWYPVPQEPAMQARLRAIGRRLIPQYQRDFASNDAAKIPFRFYVVDEPHLRSDLGCSEGLVLVPAAVMDRLHNDDQLAAVLADGIAANLQRQRARLVLGLGWLKAAEVASYVAISPAGIVGTKLIEHNVLRKLEDERGRIALGLMSDAGFDPWQAPEAWRLLAPGQLPKNPAKLKYPARSEYQLEILRLQYRQTSNVAGAQSKGDNSAEQ